MVVVFPDVSNQDTGLHLMGGTQAVIAKASEGHTFLDPDYLRYKKEASSIGALFSAYHWLHPGNEILQAQACYDVVGPDVDLMIDVENVSGDGPNSVANVGAFTVAYRRLGGLVRRLYLPHWYWRDHMHSPDLSSLEAMGLLLVASDYRTFDVNNWPVPYGGYSSVYQWQFTDAYSYGGQKVDMNAVRTSLTEHATILYGGNMPSLDGVQASELSNADDLAFGIYTLQDVNIIWGNAADGTKQAYPNGLLAWTKNVDSKLDALSAAQGELVKQVQAATAAVQAVSGSGLSDTDRATLQGFAAAVTALLNHVK